MHIIQDLEGFLKHIEETIHTYFGNGRATEEGKDAVLAAIVAGGAPVITGMITPAIPDEQPIVPVDDVPEVPIDAPVDIITIKEGK